MVETLLYDCERDGRLNYGDRLPLYGQAKIRPAMGMPLKTQNNGSGVTDNLKELVKTFPGPKLPKLCGVCGSLLTRKRTDQRYCSGRCRVAAYRKERQGVLF